MNLEQLLSTPKLTDQVPQASQIRERARLVAPHPMKLFYGETYDDRGHSKELQIKSGRDQGNLSIGH